MADERQIPGGVFVNETNDDESQIPGALFVNQTASAGAGADVVIDCTAGAATSTGVTALLDVSIGCTAGSATASGTTALLDVSIGCTAGEATASGVACVVSVTQLIDCTAGEATASGTTALLDVSIGCDAGEATASGITCVIDDGAAPVARAEEPAGKPSRDRKRRRYQVEIDGRVYDVDSPDEAKAVIAEAAQRAQELAQQAIDRAANAPHRARRKVLADARKALRAPEIRVDGSDAAAQQIAREADVFMQRLDALYADTMRSIEIGALMRQRLAEDEDDAMTALMLTL